MFTKFKRLYSESRYSLGIKDLLFEINEQILIIKLNRPKYLNSLNSNIIAELERSLLVAENDKDIKVVLLSGEGKAFAGIYFCHSSWC
jgi:enoyl-CoA hydratase